MLFAAVAFVPAFFPVQAFGNCNSPHNAIERENCKPGNPQSEWDIPNYIGDTTIQGFATNISVNAGQTIQFKVNTDATAYKVDIYRIGYYGGSGARLITSITPSVPLPQTQPACLSKPDVGLIDCGNWAVSASWSVPGNAVSGVYVARLVRADSYGTGASHIIFIVRDDNGRSDLLFQTSDLTWQAYNDYGANGQSLYGCYGNYDQTCRARKASYNRPLYTRLHNVNTSFFATEYPMVRWLEANGYDVSYVSGVDVDRSGSLLLSHKVYMSVGHDEYWSGNQRTNVEKARAAGVHLAFFSGNEMFWKTRWESSIDSSATPYRTLVCYKETLDNAITDPQDPPVWTGTWRDPRFSPPADGGRPENALTGTLYMMNGPISNSIVVPQADGKMRFWRNTAVANQVPGQSYTMPIDTLGYEWDIDADNGVRPDGLFRLSTATVSTPNECLLDYGGSYGACTLTHHATMYKYNGKSIVFGAGTVQWSWGLDGHHDNGAATTDLAMQQATVNLLADMGVQPNTLVAGLVRATASTDVVKPVSSITTPAIASQVSAGVKVTITGTARDSGGGVVGGVDVSVDGGLTWHPANGRESWNYDWTPQTAGAKVVIRSRAVDDSGNVELPATGTAVTVVAAPSAP